MIDIHTHTHTHDIHTHTHIKTHLLQYMRVAVDNGHADTIKKMERLFTEFWKLNEPG